MIPRIDYGPCPICQDYHDRYIAAYPDRARVLSREWEEHLRLAHAPRKRDNTQTYPPSIGDRIELVAMPNDPDPILVGEQGIVESVVGLDTRLYQINVTWDSGRTLALSVPPDQFRVIKAEEIT
jgi:hypothetical protein